MASLLDMRTLCTLLLLAAVGVTAGPAAASASAPPGGPLRLGVPRDCVPVDGTIAVTLDAGRAAHVTAVTFAIDGRRAGVDHRAPFGGTLSVKGLQPQTLHELTARATIAGRHGRRAQKRSVKAVFAVCGR